VNGASSLVQSSASQSSQNTGGNQQDGDRITDSQQKSEQHQEGIPSSFCTFQGVIG
jgi:hypothetical protein